MKSFDDARPDEKIGSLGRRPPQMRGDRRNPTSILFDQGSSPKNRNLEKQANTLFWLSKFIFSTEKIILDYLQIQGRGWMRQLEKKGLVSSSLTELKVGILWHLTKKGLQHAQALFESDFNYYPERPDKLKHKNLKHDLMAQIVVLKIIQSHEIEYDNFIEIQSSASIGFWEGGWTPDARIEFESHILNIEIELNQKYGMEMEKKLAVIIRHLNNNDRSRVQWYSNSEATLNNYKDRAINGVPAWNKSPGLNWSIHDFSLNFENRTTIYLSNPIQWSSNILEKDPRSFL